MNVIYLNFLKAFDKIPINACYKKVQALGTMGTVYRWTEDWLKNRMQWVQFGGACSDWIPVLSGVPHGSVFGPNLFLIYINKIKLYRRMVNYEDVTKLQEDLALLSKWSREWLMLFNADESKILNLSPGNQMVLYVMNGVVLQAAQEEIDLGITGICNTGMEAAPAGRYHLIGKGIKEGHKAHHFIEEEIL